jgi:two-component system chemotaxis response regulator CheY
MSALATSCAVLIVEDHADTADMLRSHLKRQGCDADIVDNGQAALDFLQQRLPRCLIVDEGLPVMNGLSLLRQLQARPEYRHLPVIFYSGAYDWRKQMEAEALGAKAWFIKGVSNLKDVMSAVLPFCTDHPSPGNA